MRSKVAHIVPSDQIAHFLLSAQLVHLREAGFDVSVVCGKVAYAADLESKGLQVHHVPFAREMAPLTDLRCTWHLYQWLRKGRYDIIHTHNPKGGLIGPVAGRLARHAVVVHTVHGFLFNENSSMIYRLLALGAEHWTAAWCDHLLFQSKEDYDYALRNHFKTPERLRWIGNGIDHRRFDLRRYPNARETKRRELGLDEKDLVVGMVGRLVADKGFREFFYMAKHIAKTFSRARFVVVGITEEDQSNAIDPTTLSIQHGIEKQCVVLEQRQDMPELYLCMDVAVLPSYREGIPRALMEAAAMGVAIAASDIRGCREVIVDGKTGLLFPLKDVDGLTRSVHTLLADTGVRQRLANAGQQRVLNEYTESGTAQRLINFYEELLGKHSTATDS